MSASGPQGDQEVMDPLTVSVAVARSGRQIISSERSIQRSRRPGSNAAVLIQLLLGSLPPPGV
jgi:hypothetical protein